MTYIAQLSDGSNTQFFPRTRWDALLNVPSQLQSAELTKNQDTLNQLVKADTGNFKKVRFVDQNNGDLDKVELGNGSFGWWGNDTANKKNFPKYIREKGWGTVLTMGDSSIKSQLLIAAGPFIGFRVYCGGKWSPWQKISFSQE